MKRFPGCGSGCDTYSFIASAAPLPPTETINDDPDPPLSSTPAVEDFQVYRDAADSLFVAQHAGDTLELLKLTRTGRWERACSIALAPNLRESKDAAVASALASVDSLLREVDRLQNREANCGSMHTHSRRGQWMTRGFEAALYRPWSLTAPETYPSDGLSAWAMTGVAEHAAYSHYVREVATTTLALTQFYRDKFGWDETSAQVAADRSIRTAIGRGFGMSGYQPFRTDQELEIRKAIIARAPLDAFEAIGATAEQLSYHSDEFSQRADSVLNLAVAYPTALRYLLDLGLDPNVTNEFGKTPLMYAAQQNELASLRILLEHGGDPNAATTAPSDRCRYSLQTFGVTALHYAVRYSSAEVAKALLDAGAVEFAEARGDLGGTPMDWLRRYAGSTAVERNPNLDDAALRRVANLLEPETAAQSVDQAHERTPWA